MQKYHMLKYLNPKQILKELQKLPPYQRKTTPYYKLQGKRESDKLRKKHGISSDSPKFIRPVLLKRLNRKHSDKIPVSEQVTPRSTPPPRPNSKSPKIPLNVLLNVTPNTPPKIRPRHRSRPSSRPSSGQTRLWKKINNISGGNSKKKNKRKTIKRKKTKRTKKSKKSKK